MNDLTDHGPAVVDGGSFRDPSGFVYRSGGRLFRQVNEVYRSCYDLLMSSGLYDELVERGWLVAHREVEITHAAGGPVYKVIEPDEVPFISYPYEWCFSQLKDAAQLTLKVQGLAMEKGMTLKDASAYNVQFVDGHPIFIDTLSFEPYDPERPWVAYRQFCQHFLAPLALMQHVDVSLGRMLSLHIDGIPLALASAALPWKTKWSPTLGIHIHAHAKSQEKHARAGAAEKGGALSFSRGKMKTLLSGLQIAVDALQWAGGGTEWADYYEATHNYGEQGLDVKAEMVDAYLEQVQADTVWDLGANIGRFSQLAADRGAVTVAWDIDPSCVEWNYRRSRKNGNAPLLPLLQDLTNPSAGIGWNHQERASLADRGPVDLVMALGLIHHLVISNNVPMRSVASYLASLSSHLMIEFVPKSDSQVQLLLATREDIFPDYELDSFRRVFGEFFELMDEQRIEGTERSLLLFRSK